MTPNPVPASIAEEDVIEKMARAMCKRRGLDPDEVVGPVGVATGFRYEAFIEDARAAHAVLPRSEGNALTTICNMLWEHDSDREPSTDMVYCGRCQQDGGVFGQQRASVHWSDVPHDKDCLYALAIAAIRGPAEICPDCDGQGWYVGGNFHTGEAEQVQCQRCNCTGKIAPLLPRSEGFNAGVEMAAKVADRVIVEANMSGVPETADIAREIAAAIRNLKRGEEDGFIESAKWPEPEDDERRLIAGPAGHEGNLYCWGVGTFDAMKRCWTCNGNRYSPDHVTHFARLPTLLSPPKRTEEEG